MVDQVAPLRKPLTARATLVGLLGAKAQPKIGRVNKDLATGCRSSDVRGHEASACR